MTWRVTRPCACRGAGAPNSLPIPAKNWNAHRCIPDLKDECAEDHGGCWRQEYTVNGETKLFHACQDNIEIYKARRRCIMELLRW